MRPVEFGEAFPPGTRLTLFSYDKPDRFFMVIEFSIDKTLATNETPGLSDPERLRQRTRGLSATRWGNLDQPKRGTVIIYPIRCRQS
jgi:hypothetical protein